MCPVNASTQLDERFLRNRYAAANVEDLAVLSENERAACESDACRIGAAADHVRPIPDHAFQIGVIDTEAQAPERRKPRRLREPWRIRDCPVIGPSHS